MLIFKRLRSIAAGVLDTGRQNQPSSPTRLGHSGQLPFQGQQPEADPAQLELAQKPARPATAHAAIDPPNRELGFLSRLRYPSLGCHV